MTIHARAEQWQDIATAPKDGSHILVYFPQIGVWEVFWSTQVFDSGFWGVTDNKNEYMALRGWSDEPTHWMPLPAPPGEVQQPIPRYRVMDDRPCSQCGAPLIWDNVCRGADCLFCLHQAFAACTCDEVQQPIPQPSGDVKALIEEWRTMARAFANLRAYSKSAVFNECADELEAITPQPSGDMSRVLAEMVEFFEAVRLNDTTRPYNHHQPRKSDGKRPRESNGGGSCFLTPREIADNALRRLSALSSSSSLPSDPEKSTP